MCAAFERQQAPLVAAIHDAWPANPALSPSFGRCFLAGSAGAWGISIDSVDRVAGHLVGRWSLVHLAKDGGRIAVGPTLLESLPTKPANFDDALTLDTPALFDFDGDGEDEVLLRLAHAPKGRERAVAGHLWTFRQGRITRYANAPDIDIEALRDVDHDGRPDLETFSPWQAPSRLHSPCAPPIYRLHGPRLIAHALQNGAFSLDDEVAQEFARASCGVSLSASAFTVPLPQGDGERMVTALGCARLHGAKTDEIVAAIDASCGAPNAVDECADTQTCDDPRLWRRFAALTPPFSLP